MGLMTYDSTVSSSIVDMNRIADIESYLPWSYEIKDPYPVSYTHLDVYKRQIHYWGLSIF